MKEAEAIKLVDDTFTRPYDEARLRVFVHNLFHEYERLAEKASVGRYIPDAFKHSIVSCKRLAKFTDPQGMRLDVLSVKLPSRRALENARTMQRNFIARYLNGGRGGKLKDAALVAFYADDSDDWRFSLVRMDYVLDEEKQKIKKELTPARRYSFLVGTGEKTHTARRQLLPILQSAAETTLAELENAFNIETVTNEFFRQYKALYLSLKAALDNHVKNDEITRKEFTDRGIDTAGFAKRLLGQIVFLYFLQKKGWLGVARGAQWGTGPKDFLQGLYRAKNYHNFFNDVLEHLFYDALATERQTQDHYFPRLECRIPFLNGGLFEPFKGYAWDGADILLDDKIFADIFAVFDLYNFTVREDEPLDKEVAVDPEMLGKVFENLIPENERKGSGTFYTPREIVHYMCQESLVNYLDAALNISSRPSGATTEYEDACTPRVAREDIAEFIYHGDTAREHDATAQSKNANGDYKGGYRHKIPASVREHAREIDAALAGVKICDPAIGSGAFPVGVMNEIVRARAGLNAYLGEDGRAAYDFKRHAIQESIYGVDIEPSAVDIAKLRLWLSLIVDEEDFGTIKPLPNLEYKIMAGDSLISEISQKDLGYKGWLDELVALQKSIFSEYSPSKKQAIKAKIDALLENLFQGHDSAFRFNYWIQFYDVMNSGGFDIVIANPPYVSIEKFSGTRQQKDWKNIFEVFSGRGDIYCLFYELGFWLLKKHGGLCFITSNKFFRAAYGRKMRAFFTSHVSPHKIIDFQDLPVFDATAYPCIAIAGNVQPAEDQKVLTATIKDKGEIFDVRTAVKRHKNIMPLSDLSVEGWTFTDGKTKSLLDKIRKSGIPLKKYVRGEFYYGIKTGFNDAFVIDGQKRAELIGADPNSEDLIKPWLRGKDIKRWYSDFQDLFLLFIRHGTDIDLYPKVKQHLKGYKSKLEPKPNNFPVDQDWDGRKPGHYKWYEIQDNIAYYEAFDKPKITWGNLATAPKFTYDESGAYVSAPANIIPTDEIWLTGLLNSPVCRWLISLWAAERSGGYLEFKPMYVGKIPIPNTSEANQEAISKIVRTILAIKKKSPDADVRSLERQINRIVYDLYSLTPEEIAIIEEAVS